MPQRAAFRGHAREYEPNSRLNRVGVRAGRSGYASLAKGGMPVKRQYRKAVAWAIAFAALLGLGLTAAVLEAGAAPSSTQATTTITTTITTGTTTTVATITTTTPDTTATTATTGTTGTTGATTTTGKKKPTGGGGVAPAAKPQRAKPNATG